MPSFNDLKRIYSSPTTVGQRLKQNSDEVMHSTWDNDIQSRTCYIYDYYHDNTKDEFSDYVPNEESGKKKISLKFIVTAYKSLAKDDPEYHIQFDPNDWNTNNCIPDWWNDYNGEIQFPLGLYVDIPDDRGIYHKYLIVYSETANQFPKFGIVKCNYLFTWVTNIGEKRLKREMIGAQRTQSSYNSGIYSYTFTTKMENQSKFWLPYNDISAEIYYNQRLIVSMIPPKHLLKQVGEDSDYIYYTATIPPITYLVSKVENTVPKGVNMFTIYQNEYNDKTDRIIYNKQENEYKMYADYVVYNGSQVNEIDNDTTSTLPAPGQENANFIALKLSCANSQIRINGGYKTITVKLFDSNNEELPADFAASYNWKFYIGEEKEIATDKVVTLETTDLNKMKIKLSDVVDEEYIRQPLTIICETTNDIQQVITNELMLDIIAL